MYSEIEQEESYPKLVEVTTSVSTGGRKQLLKFELSADWHYSSSRKYTIPENWDDESTKKFIYDATQDLRAEVHKLAQEEIDNLEEQTRALNDG